MPSRMSKSDSSVMKGPSGQETARTKERRGDAGRLRSSHSISSFTNKAVAYIISQDCSQGNRVVRRESSGFQKVTGDRACSSIAVTGVQAES